MTPMRLEPAAPRSRVKHSTTEPLRSHLAMRKTEKAAVDKYIVWTIFYFILLEVVSMGSKFPPLVANLILL